MNKNNLDDMLVWKGIAVHNVPLHAAIQSYVDAPPPGIFRMLAPEDHRCADIVLDGKIILGPSQFIEGKEAVRVLRIFQANAFWGRIYGRVAARDNHGNEVMIAYWNYEVIDKIEQ